MDQINLESLQYPLIKVQGDGHFERIRLRLLMDCINLVDGAESSDVVFKRMVMI
jgi:hypothetical protein